jgi:hypothetical protein
MGEDAKLIGYCGFFCGDCLGYTGVVAEAAERLVGVLDRHQFGRTAECIFPTELKDYSRVREALGFMAGLRCAGICRAGAGEGGASHCDVRKCCLTRGLEGCYECDDFETCDTLRGLSDGLHAEASLRNIRAIRSMGLDSWLASGRRHHYWDEDDPS